MTKTQVTKTEINWMIREGVTRAGENCWELCQRIDADGDVWTAINTCPDREPIQKAYDRIMAARA